MASAALSNLMSRKEPERLSLPVSWLALIKTEVGRYEEAGLWVAQGWKPVEKGCPQNGQPFFAFTQRLFYRHS